MGSTLREKLPRSVRLRYINWGAKERQHRAAGGRRSMEGRWNKLSSAQFEQKKEEGEKRERVNVRESEREL